MLDIFRSSLDLVEKPTAKKKIREDSLTQTPIAAGTNFFCVLSNKIF